MHKTKRNFLLVILLSLIFTLIHGQDIGDECTTLSNTKGKCTNILECPDALKGGKRPPICGFEDRTPIVCCDDRTDYKNSIRYKKCQEYSSTIPQVFSSSGNRCGIRVQEFLDKQSEPGEFVHAAAIGYIFDGGEFRWACSGSLISRRFVLTVANCLNNNLTTITRVKLGFTDVTSDMMVTNAVDYNVIESIQHPSYKTRKVYNDIGLVKLDKLVTLSSYIRPICLPFNSDIPQNAIENTLGNSNINDSYDRSVQFLNKDILEIIDNASCNKSYKRVGRLELGIVESQICAAPKVNKSEKTPCVRSSGGPLIMYNPEVYCMYTLIGANSFGIKGCISREFPDVYTNVYHFVDWIERLVWANNNE